MLHGFHRSGGARNLSRASWICSGSLLALFLCGPVLWAQGTTADIVGTVSDASGAVLPSIPISLKNLGTAAEYRAVTDGSGNYIFTLLPVGHYSMQVAASGFKTLNIPDVTLAIGDRLRQDIHLEVGALTQTMDVTASSPALQSDSSSLGSLISERAVQDLPLNGRNFVVLAQLAAGATEGEPTGLPSGTRPDDRRQTSAVSVNAQPTSFNNFLIDGMDDNERFIGTVIVKPSIDALVEMRVQTNLYSAELGRTAGGVIDFITKSGTNAMHGSLFEFLRNEKLDARNFFAGAIKPSYKQNQFGGSVGGPIRKDRTFFFGDYERFRQRQGQTFASTVPTLGMRQGNFSGANAVFDPFSTRASTTVPGGSVRTRFAGDQIPVSRQDPVGLQLLNLYPLPQTTGLVNNFTLNPTRSQNNDTFDVRVDHRLSEKDTLFARYSFNNTDTFLPGAFPTTASGIDPVGDTGRSGTAKQRAHGAQINNVHIFGPHLVMEAKAGFTRYSVQSLPLNYGKNVDDQLGIKGANFDADSSGLSIINVAGFRPLGDASYIPLLTVNNTFQELVNFTYLQGSHSIKVGADLRRRQVSAFQSPFSKGQFSFDANLTNDPSGLIAGSGNSAASLLLGYPAATTRSKYLVYPGLRLWETAAYIQDDWRATRWLTLNMGVRYDYFGPVTEVANRLSNIDLATGKIIIAGQNGVSPSAGVQADKVNFAPRFGFAATLAKGTVLRGGYGISFVPNMIASSMALRNPPFVSLYTVTATPLTPLNRISDGLPLPVPTSAANPAGDLNGVAPVGSTPYVHQYNLTLQRELPWGLVATVSYAAALGHKQYIFNGAINLNQPAPAPGAIQPRRPYYSVLPNVSAINIAAPWYNTNYQSLQSTLEHRYKSGLSILATYTYAHSIDDQVQMVNDRKVERGNSFLDVRSRFTLLANYRLPFARKAQGFGGLLARNWTVNAVTVLTTGIPFNITNAAPRANTGGNDRPNLIGDPNLPDSQQSVYQWFNTGAFAAQPLYTFGNLARNALHSPGRKSLDLSIYREFIPTERFRVQFRAESFNLTNTPAFSAPGATLGSATFGVISSAGLPRNLQFGLKLLF